MGADNWCVCPKCLAKHVASRDNAIRLARNSYGNVDPPEYERLTREASGIPEEPEESLREDYAIGVDKDGEFDVSYSCSCNACGFRFHFKHKEKLKL